MVVLMEGCFASELSHHVDEPMDHTPLWSASFLHTHRDACIKAHRALVAGGVEILCTGSYQATIEGLMKHLNLSKKQALDLLKDSVQICRESVEAEGKTGKVKVAASIGPYGAFLHDGSEYTGKYGNFRMEDLREWHRERMTVLVEAKPDLLAFETIPCSAEALALVDLLKEMPPDMKALLAFSTSGPGNISSGEDWVTVASRIWDMAGGRLLAVGVNCCHPDLVSPHFRALRSARPDIPFIAYPNSGETYDTASGRWLEGSNKKYVTDYSEEWIKLGIDYLGGCCRTYSSDMKEFRRIIDSHASK